MNVENGDAKDNKYTMNIIICRMQKHTASFTGVGGGGANYILA